MDWFFTPDIECSIMPSLFTKNIAGIPVTFSVSESSGAWIKGCDRFRSNSDSMRSFHSFMSLYLSLPSLLKMSTWPSGTVSSNASKAGLQWLHHDAENVSNEWFAAVHAILVFISLLVY